MAFAVSKWPYSPDPRSAVFGGYGFAWGAVSPWAWILTTTGANGPWAYLNDSVLLKSTYDDLELTLWNGEDLPPGDLITFSKFGQQPPSSGSWSIVQTLQFRTGAPVRLSEDHQNYQYPDAIQVFDGWNIILVSTGLPDPWIPNPVVLTPAVWDYELP